MTKLVVLDDSQLETATLDTLRAAYRALRDAHAAEVERHATAIREALAELKAKGKKTGGYVPYGYKLAADGATLVEHPKEQRVIAEARRLRSDGYSLRAIAQKLYEHRPSMRSRTGDRFDSTQIHRMLGKVRSSDAE